jgi:RNA polymerase sigma factor for flagellar operon FliA
MEEISTSVLHSSKQSKRASASEQDREEMLEAYLPLVRLIAEKIHRRLPSGVDLGSLVHSGVVGLLEALQRYDTSRGVAFQTFARYRIQGEIIEYLRSLDWVSRSVRSWGRKVAAARGRVTGRVGHEASPEEMAKELGVSLEEYYRVDQKVNDATLLSLEDLSVASEEEWCKEQGRFSHNPFQDPLLSVEGKDLVEKLTAAVDVLPERERLVISLYYHEELTLREIGEILGLTEGRICQIHSQAVLRLRQALDQQDSVDSKREPNRTQSPTAVPVEAKLPVTVRPAAATSTPMAAKVLTAAKASVSTRSSGTARRPATPAPNGLPKEKSAARRAFVEASSRTGALGPGTAKRVKPGENCRG